MRKLIMSCDKCGKKVAFLLIYTATRVPLLEGYFEGGRTSEQVCEICQKCSTKLWLNSLKKRQSHD